jgi:saccharopine dehydrogenase-like NADP-dependent oxidoreductase
LVELGFASRDPVVRDAAPREMLLALAARQSAPAGADPDDCDVLRVDAVGRRAGHRETARAEMTVLPHLAWKVAAGSLDTGVPLSIAAQMLAARKITEPGVLCPETAVAPDPFFAELARRGMQARFEFEGGDS